MESNPKIQPELSSNDIILEIAGWLALSLLWILILYNYSNLPESIPIHFNAAGQVDSYGGKSTIFLLPVLGTILFIGMSILNKYPHIFNYPVSITPENALKQYTMATRMIRYLKLAIVIIFSSIVQATNFVSAGKANGLGLWFLPVILSVIFIPLTLFIYKSFKAK